MHVIVSKNNVSMISGKGMLLRNIKVKPLPQGGETEDIISKNRIVGITSNAVNAPPSNTMAKIGGTLDFSKHVKKASQSIQKKKDRDENIKFVF